MTKVCVLLLFAASFAAFAQRPLLWRDPGAVEYADFAGGPGGRANAPRGPFRFIESDDSGTAPKVIVRDLDRKTWVVKWGPEVKAENFATRLVWAMGYYTEPVYYVRAGRIRAIRDLGRADKFISKSGAFRDARFELRNPPLGKFVRQQDWTWNKNPFVGTREMNGLKVLVMLTSNWDNKDARDNGSNTGILQRGSGPQRQWIYLITDWGGSMGKWGNFFTEKWDCDGFRDQTPDFIGKVENGTVKFAFNGKHDGDFKEGISVGDVRWLMQYLGRVSNAQIRSGLIASGATSHEVKCFTQALRGRIDHLKRVARLNVSAPRT